MLDLEKACKKSFEEISFRYHENINTIRQIYPLVNLYLIDQLQASLHFLF